MTVYEGSFEVPADARFALVASRFNEMIVSRLVEGARDGLKRHGVSDERVDLVWVPGAWELPWAAERVSAMRSHAAIITLGAVIRGATPHFDFVAGQAASGLMSAMLKHDVPIIFGVLTTDTIEQAMERAGTKAGNKGFDAAQAALEMVSLARVLKDS